LDEKGRMHKSKEGNGIIKVKWNLRKVFVFAKWGIFEVQKRSKSQLFVGGQC
jgi:hypothetical protein